MSLGVYQQLAKEEFGSFLELQNKIQEEEKKQGAQEDPQDASYAFLEQIAEESKLLHEETGILQGGNGKRVRFLKVTLINPRIVQQKKSSPSLLWRICCCFCYKKSV